MAFDIEHFPTSESAKRMLGMVTKGYYDKSYVGKWLFQVMGLEEDELKKIIAELPAQIFPETATWSLRYHEEKWGLPIYEETEEEVYSGAGGSQGSGSGTSTGSGGQGSGSGSTLTDEERERRYRERRRRIIEKRDYVAPMTPYRMENYIRALAEGYAPRVADVHDPGPYGWTAPHPNVFRVYLIGDEDSGTIDTKAIHRTLGRIKQSHTMYVLEQRTIIVIDESDIEEIRLRNIRFDMAMPFWYCHVLDGDWLLDGRILLDQKRRYGLGVWVTTAIRIHEPKQSARFPHWGMRTEIEFPESYRMGINHSMAVSFWDVYTLNGDWLLDGKVPLNQKRRYALGLAVSHLWKAWNDTEGLTIPRMGISTEIRTPEVFKNRITHSMAMPFWGYFVLNGDWLLDGKIALSESSRRLKAAVDFHARTDCKELESYDGFTVETYTRDYWFLDGGLSMDGSRKLNSVYRKETA